jgi:hypothetical protein
VEVRELGDLVTVRIAEGKRDERIFNRRETDCDLSAFGISSASQQIIETRKVFNKTNTRQSSPLRL